MAYDEGLAQRLREYFEGKGNVVEKKMFGGIAFMVDEKMCVGVSRDHLMARVGKEQEEKALKMPHTKPMDFTGRPMKGFIYVEPKGIEEDGDLEKFINLSQNYVNSLPKK